MATRPEPILTIDPKHRVIEGVASDGKTIWISSVLDRKILACRSSCRTIASLPPGLHPFAIALDARTRTLWIAADCPPGVPAIRPCRSGALVALDLRSGRVRMQLAPASPSFHPGDVSVLGTRIFASDSQNGAVYLLDRNSRELRPLVKSGIGKSGQGIALDASGKRLVVADYSQGIATVELATGERTILHKSDGRSQRGIDGLLRCGSTYYGIYNGEPEGALLAMSPGRSDLHVEKVAELKDPTQLTYDGKRMLLVAGSGWAELDKPDSERLTGATILAVPAPGDCRTQ